MPTRPLPVVVFNAVGAMPTNRRPLGNRILASAAKRGHLLIGVECDDLEPAAELDEDLWWWRHREAAHRDGGFLAGLRDRTNVSDVASIFGAPSSPVNDPRYFLRGKVRVDDSWTLSVAAWHSPRWKEGGRPAAEEGIRRSQTIDADVLAGDFNIRADAMRARYPSRVIRSTEVMHLAARKTRLRLGNVSTFDLLDGTESDDHPGLRVTVLPR